tara:strand:- start:405 stop:965 length:561 start_codon:yes stop_codon:yes gene_type:complete
MGWDSNIVLVGFMGTGKTVVGLALAKWLDVRFLDTDQLIEEDQGVSIEAIFKQSGEKEFRKIEKRVVRNVVAFAKREPCVIATGGGTVVDTENLQCLKTIGPMVCLYADPEVIHARTVNDTCRPLLPTSGDMDRISAIEELLSLRRPSYESADICIDTSQGGIGDIVASVIKHLDRVNGERMNCVS